MATINPAIVDAHTATRTHAMASAAHLAEPGQHVADLSRTPQGWLATYAPSPTLADLARMARDSLARNQPGSAYGAAPYLQAMATMPTADLSAMYGADDAASLLRYALSNLTTWRGAAARDWKATVKAMLATHDARR